MAKGKNQKLKLLYLAKILYEETDADKGLKMPELIARLAAYGVEAQRKGLYDDLAALEHFGFNIYRRKEGKYLLYGLAEHAFTNAEVKLLVDAIQSSRFLTAEMTDEMTKKLGQLGSIMEAKSIKRQVYVPGRIKSMNESVYLTVDQLHKAIANNCQIAFQYSYWDEKGEMQLRHDGALYEVSPLALFWDHEYYYLIAYDKKADKIKHYRVDKMIEIQQLRARRRGMKKFERIDKGTYTKKRFGMFDGEEVVVTLQCENEMSNVIYDRFGRDLYPYEVDDSHFEVRVEVAVSDIFFGWIASIGGVKIVGPESVVVSMKDFIHRTSMMYE